MATRRRHAHTRSATPSISYDSIADLRTQIRSFDHQLRALEAERNSLLHFSHKQKSDQRSKGWESLPLSGNRSESESAGLSDSLENVPEEQLETFGLCPQKTAFESSSPQSPISSPSTESPPSFPSTTRPYSPPEQSSQLELTALRASLAHSLQYQDALYREIERLMDLFEAEKHRWKDQIRRLKDEHQTEVEALRRAYEERLKVAQERKSLHQSGEYSKLMEACNAEKEQMRTTLTQNHQIAMELLREQLKMQQEMELQRVRQEADRNRENTEIWLQEEVKLRIESELARLRSTIRSEVEEELETEREACEQKYDQLLKSRIATLKSEHERKVKELQEQISALKRDKVMYALGCPKRTALEELEMENFVSTHQVLCSRCSALLQVSKELDSKLARFRQLSTENRII